MFLSHEQTAIISISCVMAIVYIAALSDESIFKTDNSYGRISYGLFKTCLLKSSHLGSQGYIPTGCYDYGSSYGKVLSNDCQIFDGNGHEIDFCDKRKAAASFVVMAFIALVASIVLSVLAVMELPCSSTVHIVSTVSQSISFLFVMIGFCILASMNTAYNEFDDDDQNQTFDLDYGPTFILLVFAWILHFVNLILHLLVDPSAGGPVVPVGQMRMLSTDPNPFAKPVTGDPFNSSGQDSPFDDDDDDLSPTRLVSLNGPRKEGSLASMMGNDSGKGSIIPGRNPTRNQGSTVSSGSVRRGSNIMPGQKGLLPVSEEDPLANLLGGARGSTTNAAPVDPSVMEHYLATHPQGLAGDAGNPAAAQPAASETTAGPDAPASTTAANDGGSSSGGLALPSTGSAAAARASHIVSTPDMSPAGYNRPEGDSFVLPVAAPAKEESTAAPVVPAHLERQFQTTAEMESTPAAPVEAASTPAPGYSILAEVTKQSQAESDASSKATAPDATVAEAPVDTFGNPYDTAADNAGEGPISIEVQL